MQLASWDSYLLTSIRHLSEVLQDFNLQLAFLMGVRLVHKDFEA